MLTLCYRSQSHCSAEDYNKPTSNDLTHHEVQIVKYVNELLSHGVRMYASGFLVETYTISLWYADRLGIVKSQKFNFLREPHYLLLMALAIVNARSAGFGFCSLFQNLPRDPTSYAGATFFLPQSLDVRGDSIGDLSFAIDINKNRNLVTSYGAVGRGTTFVPVRVHHEHKEFLGLGNLVVKMSWQRVECREDSHIRMIRTSLASSSDMAARHALSFIVDMKYSSRLHLNNPLVALPRAFMKHLGVLAIEDSRDLCCLILKEYLPLQQISSVDELKKVFREVLTGSAPTTFLCCPSSLYRVRRASLGLGNRRHPTSQHQPA